MSLLDQSSDDPVGSVDKAFDEKFGGEKFVVKVEVEQNGNFTIKGNIKKVIKVIAMLAGYAGWLAVYWESIRPG